MRRRPTRTEEQDSAKPFHKRGRLCRPERQSSITWETSTALFDQNDTGHQMAANKQNEEEQQQQQQSTQGLTCWGCVTTKHYMLQTTNQTSFITSPTLLPLSISRSHLHSHPLTPSCIPSVFLPTTLGTGEGDSVTLTAQNMHVSCVHECPCMRPMLRLNARRCHRICEWENTHNKEADKSKRPSRYNF